MEVEASTETEQQKSAGQFNRYADGWFYEDKSGRKMGPFDAIYETVLEPWTQIERTITEPELSRVMLDY